MKNELSLNEKNELFKEQTNKYLFLNQTINEYDFEVIDTPDKLMELSKVMKNAAREYIHKIIAGEYLILTVRENHCGSDDKLTNFGLRIEDSNLIFDEGVNLKMYQNKTSPKEIAVVFKEFADKNNIQYKEIKYLKQEIVSL